MGITLSCLKWRMLLRAKGYELPLPYLIGLYLMGYFFHNFLPSMVGGDVARGYYLGKRIGNAKDAYLSIFMERITGMFALLALTVGVAFAFWPHISDLRLQLPLGLFLVCCFGGIGLLFSKRFFSLAARLAPAAIREKLDRLHDSLSEFRRHRGVFAMVLFISLIFHVVTGINVLYACHAFHHDAHPLEIILTTPLILVVSMIPVSLNGIGLWEGGFVVFLSFADIPHAVALSAALLLRVKHLPVSAVGGVIFWLEGRKGRAELLHDAGRRKADAVK
jgi:uncharacterized protein (TIRG00374 family)